MALQVLIIGLGQFGMSLAKTLSSKGAEVLAADLRKELVDEASTFVANAVVVDASDELDLSRLNPSKRDFVVCAIGEDSREASIICTALLKQMGVKKLIARANDKIHQRILQLIGAHEIINPEQEFGLRFANRIMYSSVVADTALGEDLLLSEITIEGSMVGKSLIDLSLPKKFGVMVVAVRSEKSGKISMPNASMALCKGDNLIIASNEQSIEKFIKAVK